MLFGTYKLKNPENVHHALKTGFAGLDCASIYQNEKEIGQVLKKHGWTHGKKRESIWIQSKIWRSVPPEDYDKLLKKTLKQLQIEKLDCWLLHWPGPGRLLYRSPVRYKEGKKVPTKVPSIPSTWSPEFRFRCYSALVRAMENSKVDHVGVCNYSPALLTQLIKYCKSHRLPYPSVVQNEYHPLLNNSKLQSLCNKYSITLQAFGLMHKEVLQNKIIHGLSEKLHTSQPSLLLSWINHHGIIPIVRSENKAHQAENVKIMEGPIPKRHLCILDKIKQVTPQINTMFTWERELDPDHYL